MAAFGFPHLSSVVDQNDRGLHFNSDAVGVGHRDGHVAWAVAHPLFDTRAVTVSG